VKTHWPMVTPFLSQIALSFGCDDVEGTVVFLASADSAFMTGQTLVVDGGSVFV